MRCCSPRLAQRRRSPDRFPPDPSRFRGRPLSLRTDVREANLDVLGRETARGSSASRPGCIHRPLCRSGPPGAGRWVLHSTRREVRAWPVRLDRKDKFDLADIGGEPDAPTHTTNIAGKMRRPKSPTGPRLAHSQSVTYRDHSEPPLGSLRDGRLRFRSYIRGLAGPGYFGSVRARFNLRQQGRN